MAKQLANGTVHVLSSETASELEDIYKKFIEKLENDDDEFTVVSDRFAKIIILSKGDPIYIDKVDLNDTPRFEEPHDSIYNTEWAKRAGADVVTGILNQTILDAKARGEV